MILDASVGGSASNSFITRERALELAPVVLSPLDLIRLTQSSVGDIDNCLMRSTRMIDRSFEWMGIRYQSDQSLTWPRFDVYIDGDDVLTSEIPRPVEDATIILAARLLSGYTSTSGLSTSASKVKIGPIEVTLNDEKSSPRSALPEEVLAILSAVGSYTGPMSGARVLKTVRA